MSTDLAILGDLCSRSTNSLSFGKTSGKTLVLDSDALRKTDLVNQTIDDDEISCRVPHLAPSGEFVNVTFCTIYIKLCQILSRASKRLSSARALRQSKEELVKAITELDQEIASFKLSIKDITTLDEPLDLAKLPAGFTIGQITWIHFLYYSLMLDIHVPLTCPWFHDPTNNQEVMPFLDQVERSSSIVANSARAAILATRFVELDVNSPVL